MTKLRSRLSAWANSEPASRRGSPTPASLNRWAPSITALPIERLLDGILITSFILYYALYRIVRDVTQVVDPRVSRNNQSWRFSRAPPFAGSRRRLRLYFD